MCQFCNIECELPNLGSSDHHWYWQPNKSVSVGGTYICKAKKRCNVNSWEKNNPEKAKYKYDKARNKRRSTVEGKLKHNVSSLISYHVNKKDSSMSKYLDYSIIDLKAHLESKFKPGMTWDNYGEWEIDHITPVSWYEFNSVKDESFKNCWALKNLQPMWAELNKQKSNRFAGGY